MKIIISPAKKMVVDSDCFEPRQSSQFLVESQEILSKLKGMTLEELKQMWKCNDKIAAQNFERILNMNLQRNLSPAIFSYEGIQYKNIAPNILESSQLDFLEENLRIVSGFYGILNPFDGVTPYRLEMQANLQVSEKKNLYDFWGDKLANTFKDEILLNLASKEYSKAILPNISSKIHCVTCSFAELKGEKFVEKATLCKIARGQMVRWLAENQITEIEELKQFSYLNFSFSQQKSSEDNFVFLLNAEQNHSEFDF